MSVFNLYLCCPSKKECFAGVVKLVDTLDLGSSASRLGGSSPSTRTKKRDNVLLSLFFWPAHAQGVAALGVRQLLCVSLKSCAC